MPAEIEIPAGRPGLTVSVGLIETLGWWPDAGFVRLDLHLSRLERSAIQFGYEFRRNAIIDKMHSVVGGTEPRRVRIELTQTGVTIVAPIFTPLSPDTVWSVALTQIQLVAQDPRLAHKTTQRAQYDAARAQAADLDADEALLLNDRGAVCEGGITNVFVPKDGKLHTPPLSNGLLPGVLRAALLAQGRAIEAQITVQELRAQPFFMGNSLRGLIPAQLIN